MPGIVAKKPIKKRPSDAFSKRKEKPESAAAFQKRDDAMRAGFQKRKKDKRRKNAIFEGPKKNSGQSLNERLKAFKKIRKPVKKATKQVKKLLKKTSKIRR